MDKFTVREPNTTSINPEGIETEEFKLEMLDCGPAYSYAETGTACFACLCGSGCACTCATA